MRLLAIAVVIALGSCTSADGDADLDPTVIEDRSDAERDVSTDNGSDEQVADEPMSSDDSSASVSACDLLSLSDVTAAGVPVTEGPTQNEGNPNFDQCDFTDENRATVFSVSVFPPSRGGGAISDQEAIDGIGSEAFYSESQQVLNVTLDDGTFISIFLLDSSLDVRSILIELARTALG